MKKNQVESGIYCWEAISGKKIGWKYIGQTENLHIRTKTHLNDLRKKKHDNVRLQNYYNKYGKSSLRFLILMKCDKNKLNFWEKFWIKSFDSIKNGFNILEGGNNPPVRTKKCILKNMITREIVEFNSIKEFCDTYKIEQSKISRLVAEKAQYCEDWYNPNGRWQPRYHTIISPNDVKYEVIHHRQTQFCREHGLRASNFLRVLNKDLESCKGWTRPDSILRYK